MIEYSPIERELVWTATDPGEASRAERLLQLRTYSASLFHEQNHRLLWELLPPPPNDRTGLRRYLHLAESLVIMTDMALGDELGPDLASIFYLTGVCYDPGTEIKKITKNSREYRNYLQAALHATYLNLELYNPKQIPKAIRALFPSHPDLAERAAIRSGNLDRAFVNETNPRWQKQHWKNVIEVLSQEGKEPLSLPDDPMDNRLHYLLAERWFETIGL